MFVSWAKAKSGTELDSELVVETKNKNKNKTKKGIPGELLEDDPVASSDAAFEVNVHNVILDTVVGLEVFSQCKTCIRFCLSGPSKFC